MEDTTTIFIKEQGTITLMINKQTLIDLLNDKSQFINVKKRTILINEPWESDKKERIIIDEIAINKDYIVTTL